MRATGALPGLLPLLPRRALIYTHLLSGWQSREIYVGFPLARTINNFKYTPAIFMEACGYLYHLAQSLVSLTGILSSSFFGCLMSSSIAANFNCHMSVYAED